MDIDFLDSRMSPRLVFDPIADSAYMYLSPTRVSSTIEITDEVLIDLDPSGAVCGIEILSSNAKIPTSELASKYFVSQEAIEQLQRLS